LIRQFAALLMMCLSLAGTGIKGYVSQTSLGGNLYLVNRTYRLTQAYAPVDLVTVNVKKASDDVMMRQEAARMLEGLFKAAAQEGHSLVAVSGYRSFSRQGAIYRRKVNILGSAEKAQLLVAPPGASEHQLGLAMDVARRSSANLNSVFGRSAEGKWLAENAHRFGFIIRYRAEWTGITGYADEPWHIRYIGEEHAGVIRLRDIPLESYVQELAKENFGVYLADVSK
jgi:D-alanyl-D-alanine carboxypeptidase